MDKLFINLTKRLGYGANLLLSLGNNTVSRMFFVPVMHMVNLSAPRPHPACGGIPYSNAAR